MCSYWFLSSCWQEYPYFSVLLFCSRHSFEFATSQSLDFIHQIRPFLWNCYLNLMFQLAQNPPVLLPITLLARKIWILSSQIFCILEYCQRNDTNICNKECELFQHFHQELLFLIFLHKWMCQPCWLVKVTAGCKIEDIRLKPSPALALCREMSAEFQLAGLAICGKVSCTGMTSQHEDAKLLLNTVMSNAHNNSTIYQTIFQNCRFIFFGI